MGCISACVAIGSSVRTKPDKAASIKIERKSRDAEKLAERKRLDDIDAKIRGIKKGFFS